MRLISGVVLGAMFACLAAAQPKRELLGKLVKGDDPSQPPVPLAKVVLDESGSHDISNDDGLFHLFLPEVLRPGDEVTITVTVAGFAVFEPPGGKLRIPADVARTRISVRLLPKGSPKFWSDTQLRALVERTAKESNRQPSQPGSKERPDLERYLKDWAVQYGFSVEEVRAEVNRWAADVASRKGNTLDHALAAFATRNFGEANKQALDAASEAEADLASFAEAAAGKRRCRRPRLSSGGRCCL
jgi:hypothetical protein